MPVSIWPHARSRARPARPGVRAVRLMRGQVSGPDAAQIITAFSRPGELVVIPAAGTGVLLAAAAAAGRRVLGLVPGPAACHAAERHAWTGLDPAARPLAEVRAGGPALLLEAGCPEAGQAALAITGRGRACPGEPAAGPACCTRRASGCCGPAACSPSSPPAPPAPAGCAMTPARSIAAARAAGLVYAQHIVALHAAITDGQLTPGPPAIAARPARGRRARGRPRPRPQRPARVHQARRNPR